MRDRVADLVLPMLLAVADDRRSMTNRAARRPVVVSECLHPAAEHCHTLAPDKTTDHCTHADSYSVISLQLVINEIEKMS